jgi:DNA-directed RNA polymerase specialized sigma24 family protein
MRSSGSERVVMWRGLTVRWSKGCEHGRWGSEVDDVDDEGTDVLAAFTAFVADVEPRLRRALVGWCGVDGARDATAEALAWAWENWAQVGGLGDPVAYLYRVAQTRTRSRKQGRLPASEITLPDIEPSLVPALQALPPQQRTAVWLVHGCGWSYAETATAMAISASAVGTHVSRALVALRRVLEVDDARHH